MSTCTERILGTGLLITGTGEAYYATSLTIQHRITDYLPYGQTGIESFLYNYPEITFLYAAAAASLLASFVLLTWEKIPPPPTTLLPPPETIVPEVQTPAPEIESKKKRKRKKKLKIKPRIKPYQSSGPVRDGSIYNIDPLPKGRLLSPKDIEDQENQDRWPR